LWILSVAETIRRGPAGIGVVQIAVDRPVAFLDFRRPIGDDLPIDPRHDLRAGVVLQRRDETGGDPFCDGRILAALIRGAAAARKRGDGDQWNATEPELANNRHCASPDCVSPNDAGGKTEHRRTSDCRPFPYTT
jgi:hypothetical protein